MDVLVKCNQCNVEFSKSSNEIERLKSRGYKNNFCSNKCSLLFVKKIQLELKNKRIEDYYKNPKKCPQCQTLIPYKNKSTQIYCSHKCGALYTQKNEGHCKWNDEGKERLRELSKKNPYFNGTLRPPRSWVSIKRGVYKICLSCKKQFYVHQKSTVKCCSVACAKIAKIYGGYRPHSGTSKKGWYKGIFCGSSWELAWVIYHLDNNIPFKRNNEGFPYVYCNKPRKYYPDFYLINDNTYIEIKNYCNAEVDAKTKQFPYKLDVLYELDLKYIFDYVHGKYGKDYIKMYEPK
jgi:hypothetical protein